MYTIGNHHNHAGVTSLKKSGAPCGMHKGVQQGSGNATGADSGHGSLKNVDAAVQQPESCCWQSLQSAF